MYGRIGVRIGVRLLDQVQNLTIAEGFVWGQEGLYAADYDTDFDAGTSDSEFGGDDKELEPKAKRARCRSKNRFYWNRNWQDRNRRFWNWNLQVLKLELARPNWQFHPISQPIIANFDPLLPIIANFSLKLAIIGSQIGWNCQFRSCFKTCVWGGPKAPPTLMCGVSNHTIFTFVRNPRFDKAGGAAWWLRFLKTIRDMLIWLPNTY